MGVPSVAKIAGAANPAAAIGTAVAGGGIDFFSAKSLQDDAQSFTKDQWRNKHQWEASDLEKAGLNRILSLTKGGSPTGGGIASAGNPGSKAISSALQLKKVNSEIALIDAQAKNIGHQGDINAPLAQIMTQIGNALEKLIGAFGDSTQTNSKDGILANGVAGILEQLGPPKSTPESGVKWKEPSKNPYLKRQGKFLPPEYQR